MFAVENLVCTKGRSTLFEDLSFRLAAGELLWVKGDNGAGKSTLLRILAGLASPTSGRVLWKGEDIGNPECRLFSEQLVYVGHAAGLCDDLTVGQNLEFWLAFRGMGVDGRREGFLTTLNAFEIANVTSLPVHLLSFGQRKRVALSRLMLAANSKLWLLDEPFSGLDGRGVEILSGVIQSHIRSGGILIVTSHQDFHILGTPGRAINLSR